MDAIDRMQAVSSCGPESEPEGTRVSERPPFRKRTFLVSFLLPYLFILCLPVLIGWVIYFNSLGLITGEIKRADDAILRQVQQSIDSRLRDVEQLTAGIGIDSRVVSLMNANELSVLQHYTNFGLLKDMNTYLLSNRFLDKMYIYFKKSELVLSTRGTFRADAFYRQFYGNYGLDEAQWQRLLQAYYPKSYFPLLRETPDPSGNSRDILFAKSLFPYVSNHPEDSKATIFIHLSPAILDGILSRIGLSEGGSLSIINSRNELLYTTNRETVGLGIDFNALAEGETAELEMGGETMTASVISSEMTDWKYVSVIPSNLFMHKAVVIRNWAMFGLVLSIALGGILALLFSRKNYGPVRKLLRLIGEKAGVSSKISQNEYQFIEETVSGIVLEKNRLEEKQRRQIHTLRDHFLVRLIKGKQVAGFLTEELYETYGIRLQSAHFAVLVFYLDDISHFSEREAANKTREEELAQFIVKNIVEDYVRRQDHNGFVVEVDQFLVCLVNFKDRDEEKQKIEVLEIAEQALHLFESRFGILCSVGISRVCSKPEEIKLAYEEAIEAIEYKLVMGEKGIIRYADIRRDAKDVSLYGLSAALEHQFANCIRAGDYRSARQLISGLLAGYSKQASIAVVKINMSAVIHLMMTSLGSISVVLDKEFLERLDPVDRLLRCKTLKQLDVEISAILDEIEQYAVRTDERNKHTLIEEIVAFVHANYPNPDLSVSLIGDHFDVSLPYLSKMFKLHMGEGLLEYIHKVRIEKAKEMIVAGNVTVKEAAELTGYTHRDTFIRLFKKYEGVTPGKYKG